MTTVRPHPEWKLLAAAYLLTCQPGDHLTLDGMQSAMAGLDPKGHRGRAQIGRFRRELQSARGLQLIAVPRNGYRVALVQEVPILASKRMEFGRRQVVRSVGVCRDALASEEYPERERALLVDVLTRARRVAGVLTETARDVRAIALGVERALTPPRKRQA